MALREAPFKGFVFIFPVTKREKYIVTVHTWPNTGFSVSMKSLLARATVRPNGIVTDGVYVTDLPNTALVHVYAYRNKQN